MKINWVTIRNADYEVSKKFYGKFLGLELAREISPNAGMTIAFFRDKNDMEVEIIGDGNIKKAINGPSIGIEVDNYEEILKNSRENSILMSEPVELEKGMECFFIKDPNEVQIQIIKRKRDF